MSLETQRFYDFGGFRIDLVEKVLLRDGNVVRMTPKVFETLCVLVEGDGRTVLKDELMQRIWEDQFVEESNLTFNIGMLRKALGDDAARPTFIETVPKRGYRFIAEITPVIGDGNIKPGRSEPEFRNGGQKIIGEIEANSPPLDLIDNDVLVQPPDENKTRPSVSSAIASRPIIFSTIAFVIGAFLVTGFVLLRNKPSFYQRFDTKGSRFLNVQKLTDAGDFDNINISRDGKFFVYSSTDGTSNTIWLRLAATGKSVPIFTSASENFHGIGFSRRGEYIYFGHQGPNEQLKLSRISTLGGVPTLILDDLHSGWTFSPDESQIAFARFDGNAARIMIADADGKNEHEVYSSPGSRHLYGISWSPDGSSIAFCSSGPGRIGRPGVDFGIYELNLADKTEKSLTDFKWDWLEGIKWLPDQSGLLVSARVGAVGPTQIWRLGLPGGETDQITNDSSSLSLSGASEDFSQILAVQSSRVASVWVASMNDPSDAKPIAKALYDVEWSPNGKIIYENNETESTELWQTGPNGDEKKQLTVNDSFERSPVTSPDGRYIAYVSALRNGQQNIWRMDADGGNQMPLTNGEGGEVFPAFTPDSKMVVYNSMQDGSLWQVPVEGGEPRQISKEKIKRISFSPDGKRIAYFGFDRENTGKLIIKTFPECALVRELDAVFNAAAVPRIVWRENGKAVLYELADSASVGNIWEQSLDGGKPRQLTNFRAQRISNFALSPDESQIAFVRGTDNFDAVLLTGFR